MEKPHDIYEPYRPFKDRPTDKKMNLSNFWEFNFSFFRDNTEKKKKNAVTPNVDISGESKQQKG